MAAAGSGESLLDSLENLPQELKQNFAMIRDRNTKCDALQRLIDEKSDRYLSSLAPDASAPPPDGLCEMYEKLRKHSEHNVALVTKMYELVDRYIQKLDVDLAAFEAQIQGHTSRPADQPARRPSSKKAKASRKARKAADEDPLYAKAIKSPVAAEAAIRQLINPVQPVSTDGLDMPVDPNEPTYCLCNQVSYGDMVGCDNPDCPIEWFHFSCVGLTSSPRGKWYCPAASRTRRSTSISGPIVC